LLYLDMVFVSEQGKYRTHVATHLTQGEYLLISYL